jgi:GT2 family glycosyltransferase
MTLAPIVLFAYNRPVHMRRTVEALLKNELANASDLIIYSDASKNPEAADAVREVRDYIRTISGFNSIRIVERDRNWGLANSVIDGVTTVVNKYGRIIVLEDDLVVTPHFLGFMNRALERYKQEPKVIQVSGYMFPVKIKAREDALFLPLTTSWGWATWQRAWRLFDPEAKGYARLKAEPELRKRFNLDGAYDYYSMLEGQLAGEVDSWAVRWQLTAFINGSLTIYPRHSLIENAGFDDSGTHGSEVGLLTRSGVVESFAPERFPVDMNVGDSWEAVCRMLRNRHHLSVWNRFGAKMRSLGARLTKI